MHTIALFGYAFAVGLTLAGLVGTAVELVTGSVLGFRPPFVRRGHVASSLAVTLLAGPMMLAGETLAAHRKGWVGPVALGFWFVCAAVWAVATGILVIELARLVSLLLG